MRAAVDVRRPFVLLLSGLVGLSWLALAVWGQSPYGRYLNHHSLDQNQGGGGLMLVFVLGWVVMLVAMMLPTSVPIVVMFHGLTQRRPDSARLVALLLVGYLSVWTLFGLAVYIGDSFLHAAVAQSDWLAEHAWVFSPLALLLAGAYQFTPLKYLCLEKCRSPFSFIAEHWRGKGESGQAFLLGIHHGRFCIGCCWTLMLLTFAIGVGSLGWMLALGALMAVEKNLPWGRRLSPALGVLLLAWGLGLLFGLIPVWHELLG
jgi:predicted metal-binding membrane protein